MATFNFHCDIAIPLELIMRKSLEKKCIPPIPEYISADLIGGECFAEVLLLAAVLNCGESHNFQVYREKVIQYIGIPAADIPEDIVVALYAELQSLIDY